MSIKRVQFDISKPKIYDNEPKLGKVSKISTFGKFHNIDSLYGSRVDKNLYKKSLSFLGQIYSGPKKSHELNIDFSKYENHCFFDIARVKHQVTFDIIVNQYPFDGNYSDMADFIDNLGGYQKYIFDGLPRNKGFINFTGSNYIETKRYGGTSYSDYSLNSLGYNPIDSLGSFTVEFMFRPRNANDTDSLNYVLFSKYYPNGSTATNYFDAHYSGSSGTDKNIDLVFCVASASISVSVTASMTTASWHHVAMVHDQDSGLAINKIYVDGNFVAQTSEDERYEFEKIWTDSSLLIGSGGFSFINNRYVNCTGSMDEFRFWTKALSVEEINDFTLKNVYKRDNLAICYKFNEPISQSVVLDVSGFGMHGTISNFNVVQRVSATFGFDNPMTMEDTYYFPNLFEGDRDFSDYYNMTFLSASEYDSSNQSCILNLIPEHYVNDIYNKNFEFDEEPYENIVSGSNSEFTIFVSKWFHLIGSFFDEIKVFIDAFSSIMYYDATENYVSAPDSMLSKISSLFGPSIQSLFNDVSFKYFFFGENSDSSEQERTISKVRTELWKRIFTCLPIIMKSKGTMFSIKSLLRAVGINPDTNFRFIEFGGINSGEISERYRESRGRRAKYIHFTGSAPVLSSSILSSSDTKYDWTNGVAWPNRDFTIGFNVRLDNSSNDIQSFMRLKSTGSYAGITPSNFVHAQIFAVKSIDDLVSQTNRFDFVRKANNSLQVDTYDQAYGGIGLVDLTKNKTFLGSFGYPDSVNIYTPSKKLNIGGTSLYSKDNKGIDIPDPVVTGKVLGTGLPSSKIPVGAIGKNFLGKTSVATPDVVTNEVITINRTDFPIVGALIALPRHDPQVFTMVLTSTNVFDGNNWFISLSKQFVDDHYLSGTEFRLLAGRTGQEYDVLYNSEVVRIPYNFITGSMFCTSSAASICRYPYLEFGKPNHALARTTRCLPSAVALRDNIFLNTSSFVYSSSYNKFNNLHSASYDSFLSHITFYTQYLELEALLEHVRNFDSVGVQKPSAKFNFITGSEYNRLRFDVTFQQDTTGTLGLGTASFADYSQNNYHMTGCGFEDTDDILVNKYLYDSYISPYYDESPNNDQIRIWGKETTTDQFGLKSPVHEIPSYIDIDSDNGFSIEYSTAHFLNMDIINMFGCLDDIDDNFDMRSMYSPSYSKISDLMDIYENRLVGAIDSDLFFDVFKWVDNNIFQFVEKIIPNRTNYYGANYVIENHMLERGKFNHVNKMMYDKSSCLKFINVFNDNDEVNTNEQPCITNPYG